MKKKLIENILAGEQAKALNLLDEWAASCGWRKTIKELLEPVLEEIGERWAAERVSLAAGYLAGKIAEDVLLRALEAEEAVIETKGPVVIGTVEDDYHSLGRKLVGIFLKTAGWKVIDLGNDVPAVDFLEAALANDAKIIGVSAMMFSTAENIRGIRMEIDQRGLSDTIRLAVGGAVFKVRPELVAEVGGDGTAASAVDVPRLMEKLLLDSRPIP